MFELTLVGLMLSCFAAIGAKSLTEFSRHQLQELSQRRSATKKFESIKNHHERAALATSMFLCLCVSLTLWCGFVWFLKEQWSHLQWQEQINQEQPDYVAWAVMIVALTLSLTAAIVWLPSTLSRLWSTRIVFFFWPAWRFLTFCFYPLELVAKFIDAVFFRLSGQNPEFSEEEQFSEEIRTIVTEGHRDGLLENDAREMIEGVIQLGDVVASEIMTPRTDMCSMPKSLAWEEMLAFVIKVPHSRIPVYDTNRDDIIGAIFAKDLLTELAKSGPDRAPWVTLIREPHFVPETKPVAGLLQEFQKNHTHMVIVLDEYGGVSGIVTLEDILEEIVGEIVDEYDADVVDGIRQISDDSYEVLGKVHIDELNERLGIGLPDDEDYDTVAGFVLHRLGHVPVQGETLDYDGLRMTILSASRRRIESLTIEPIPEETA